MIHDRNLTPLSIKRKHTQCSYAQTYKHFQIILDDFSEL